MNWQIKNQKVLLTAQNTSISIRIHRRIAKIPYCLTDVSRLSISPDCESDIEEPRKCFLVKRAVRMRMSKREESQIRANSCQRCGITKVRIWLTDMSNPAGFQIRLTEGTDPIKRQSRSVLQTKQSSRSAGLVAEAVTAAGHYCWHCLRTYLKEIRKGSTKRICIALEGM